MQPLVLLVVFAIASPLLLVAAHPDAIHAEVHMNTPFENEKQAIDAASHLESQLMLASWVLPVNADDLKQAERKVENEDGKVKISYDLEKKGGCVNAHTIADLGTTYLGEIGSVNVACEGAEKEYKR
ncbi:hypothetical protein L596_028732 [Steinernema carpocapsae]|uniref:SCP domain-containing protein n=1 Tax=Steinernema carpocapsae TaxID=34508 RepID=A0A4U5LZ76_STECR|nr:hypothetical protein L596_028729 [Steinernema carpocapsae]TKR61646.1 hypothetical protein L596_028732 [Steinernema carpocapsae]